MVEYEIHRVESAPGRSGALLQGMKEAMGMVPNLAAAMAESPELLDSFLQVRQIYTSGTFTPQEIQVLSLTAAYENACAWCMAFHSRAAENEGVAASTIDALRHGQTPEDPRLAALSDFARAMVRNHGAVPDDRLARFLDAGYTRAQAMEVVVGMAFSLMANYAGHLADPPLDAPFAPYAWHAPAAA
jgi:AhpD family alkylhydroperoxidase